MHTVFRFLVRLVLLATGLVFAAGLAVLFLLLLGMAGVRTAWARLLGRPVAPFVFRVDPRAGFGRFYRAGQPPASEPGAGRESGAPARGSRRLPGAGDVSDVEPRQPAP